MSPPTPMTREELIELAALDALGLLDEYESALFTRSFHHAPAAVQKEIKDLQAAVTADPSLLPTAIEEMVRYWPPIHHFRRTAMRDVRIGDQEVKEGDKVLMWYPAANRDEEMFSNPDVFDIRRDPNEHLSFGIGEHFCLGASLARLELQIMFEELFAKVSKIEPVAPPRRLRSNLINGIKEMRVRLTPR